MPHPNLNTKAPSSRGFTMLELMLTIVIGALIMLGVSSLFAASRTMERAFGSQYASSTQQHITQMTIRRSLLAMQIKADDTSVARVEDSVSSIGSDGVPERDRIILEDDPTYAHLIGSLGGEWVPQRLEVVVTTPPLSSSMATEAANWARLNERDEDSLDFTALDGSGGITRSVFELRPAGEREYIMRQLGLVAPNPKADRAFESKTGLPESWTLWWRPILRSEAEYLRDGGTPMSDRSGDQDQIRTRLAGAISLLEGIDVCSWEVYYKDTKVSEYSALMMSELPAYIIFELLMKNGQYASWMFEVDWAIGDDPLDITEDETTGGGGGGSSDSDDSNGTGGSGGRDNDNSDSNDRPGGGRTMPKPNSVNNMGSDRT